MGGFEFAGVEAGRGKRTSDGGPAAASPEQYILHSDGSKFGEGTLS